MALAGADKSPARGEWRASRSEKGGLDSTLAALSAAQLLRPGDDVEPTYFFRHALTRDAAYESLLLKSRAEIHRRVAEAYSRVFPDRLDEYAALLAHHYAQAGDDARTVEYAARAGDAAARINANAEATEHYSLAVKTLKRTPGESARLCEVWLRRGRMLELTGRYPDAYENYEEMQSFGRERGDRHMELAALMARTTLHSIPTERYDVQAAEVLSQQSLSLARELGDRAAEAKILWNRLLMYSRMNMRFDLALPAGEESLAIARSLGLREQTAFSLNDLGAMLGAAGRVAEGDRALSEARALWHELDNLPMVCDNLNEASMVHVAQGRFEEAVAESEEAHTLSREIGNQWGEAFSQMWIGPAYLELGRPDLAYSAMRAAIALANPSGFAAPRVITGSELAIMLAELGQLYEGLDLTRTAYRQVSRFHNSARVWAAAHLARVLVMNGDLPRAEELVKECRRLVDPDPGSLRFRLPVDIAEAKLAEARSDYETALRLYGQLAELLPRMGFRQKLPQVLLGQGHALAALARLEEAKAALEQALAEARSIKARWSEWQILAALADLLAEREPERARELRSQARANIEEIAHHTPPDLRETWFKQERVRKLREGSPSLSSTIFQ